MAKKRILAFTKTGGYISSCHRFPLVKLWKTTPCASHNPIFIQLLEVWIQRFIDYGADGIIIQSTHQSKFKHPNLFAYLRAGI